MATENVVGNGQQIEKSIGNFGLLDKVPTRETLGHKSPAYSDARELPRATGDKRIDLLVSASKILSKRGPFTTEDVFAFTDTILQVEGSYEIGPGEHVTGVPDKIPKTGVKEITLHRREDQNGKRSVNIVYQAVPTSGQGDPDRLMPHQTRFVIGEDFGSGTLYTTARIHPIGSVEKTWQEEQTPNAARPHPHNERPTMPGMAIDSSDVPTDDLNTLRRRICEDVFLASLAKSGRIKPSKEQAEAVREELHQGNAVTELVAAK